VFYSSTILCNASTLSEDWKGKELEFNTCAVQRIPLDVVNFGRRALDVTLAAKLFYPFDIQSVDFRRQGGSFFENVKTVRNVDHEQLRQISEVWCQHLEYVCDGLVEGLKKTHTKKHGGGVTLRSLKLQNFMFVRKGVQVLAKALKTVEKLVLEQKNIVLRFESMKWNNHLFRYSEMVKKAVALQEVSLTCPDDVHGGAVPFLRACVQNRSVKHVTLKVFECTKRSFELFQALRDAVAETQRTDLKITVCLNSYNTDVGVELFRMMQTTANVTLDIDAIYWSMDVFCNAVLGVAQERTTVQRKPMRAIVKVFLDRIQDKERAAIDGVKKAFSEFGSEFAVVSCV
jgi:hypothetical protein